MAVHSYTECFWGGDLSSTLGCDALARRNQDGKRMCQELEDYLKKRAKLENDFSKSLANLVKCFKFKDQIGVLETALNCFKQELDTMSKSHNGASVYFSKQAEKMKSFRDEQSAKAKQAEDSLNKSQSSKLNQFARTQQLESSYTKKCFDRDAAENKLKEIEREGLPAKELEKARARLKKAKEDADKADDSYRTGVLMLETITKDWESSMEKACQTVQELDEKRIRTIREELWTCVNADSKMALDTDNCCEIIRQKLENCDISADMHAFMKNAGTGKHRPEYYTFKPYTGHNANSDSDTDSTNSSTNNNHDNHLKASAPIQHSVGFAKNAFSKLKRNQ